MSDITDRYSLDFDPEFADMLEKMRRSNLHSSIIQCSSPTATLCGLKGNQRRLTCSPPSSPSPHTIDLTIDSPSPPAFHQQLDSSKKMNSVNIMKIGDVTIHLDDTENDNTDDEDIMGMDDLELNLNATFTAKTMSRRKLSALEEALPKAEDQHISPKEPNATPITVATGRKLPNLYATPSPHTPENQVQLVPERRHRLGHVSSCSRPSPLCGYTPITQHQ